MSTHCPPLEAFAELLRLDAEDPRRRHLEECPRCRARATAFRSFMEMEPAPAGADREDARRKLCAAIRHETEHGGGGAESRSPASLRRMLSPAWKPALGLTAAAMLIAILVRAPGDRGQTGEMMLRGAGASAAAVEAPAATWGADGSVVLQWPTVAGADGYRVLIYNQDLEEIARLETAREATVILSAERSAAWVPAGEAVFWRVAALSHGDATSLSSPAILRRP